CPQHPRGTGWHCHLPLMDRGCPQHPRGTGWHCHLPLRDRGCPQHPRGTGWHCHLPLMDRGCPQGSSHGGSARRDEDGTVIFAMSDQKDVALEVEVTNEPSDPSDPQRDGDDAHQALLVATFPPELPYAALRPDEAGGLGVRARGGPQGGGIGDGGAERLQFGGQTPPRDPRGWSFLGGFTPSDSPPISPPSTSEQPGLSPVVARARVVIELPLAVTGVAVPPRLFFGGQVLGESAVKRESQVGSAVRFEVTVRAPPKQGP
ncbi:ITA6 protein, partial [Aegithalos caudatus]|nr:ITA6 protein [Aegithalos caudatus]